MKKNRPGGADGECPAGSASMAAVAEHPTGAQARRDAPIEADVAPRDRLRWRLVLLIGLRLTQEKYVAWLRRKPCLDAQYLVEEETFLARLDQRVRCALATLREALENA